MKINAYIVLLGVVLAVTMIYACMFGKKAIASDKRYLFVIFLIILAFMIMREPTVGIDGGSYEKVFDYCAEKTFVELLTSGRYEIGYKLLNRLVYVLGGNYWTLIILISGFVLFAYYCFIKKYSPNYWISISLFLGLDFFIFSFGILREAIAMGFVLFSIMAIIDKKPMKFYVMVILGVLFHYAAIVFIPVYLLCKIRISKRTIIIWAILAVILFFTKDLIIDFVLTNIYAPIGLEKDGLGSGGYTMLLLFFALSLFSLIVFRGENKKNDGEIGIYIKIIMIGAMVQECAVYYSLLYRVAILFLTVSVCLVPTILNKNNIKWLKVMRGIVPIAMFIYYVYRALEGSDGFVLYVPNQYAGIIGILCTIDIVMVVSRSILMRNSIMKTEEKGKALND